MIITKLLSSVAQPLVDIASSCRWATSGLDFLMIGCHPKVLSSLSREQFEATKQKVNQCLSHVVGENPQKPPPRRRGNAITSGVCLDSG